MKMAAEHPAFNLLFNAAALLTAAFFWGAGQWGDQWVQ